MLLVGHSQGGMAAAAILAGDSGFHVTDVVTAGSPTAQVPGFPDGSTCSRSSSRATSSPQLDGAPNPDSVEQTTVIFDAHPGRGVVAHHDYDAYVAGRRRWSTRSTDPSVVEAVAVAARPRLPRRTAAQVTSQVFQITRAP